MTKRRSLVMLTMQLLIIPLLFSSTEINEDLGVGASPAYSPNGRFIAYRGPAGRINIMDSMGGNARMISTTRHDFNPKWSPDGTRIVFNSYGMGSNQFSIWIVNEDGTDQHQLIEPESRGDQYPCWSPDGKWIVWSHGYRLWIMKADGQNAKPLTAVPAKAYEYCGGWSPKGDLIAYIAGDSFSYSSPDYYRIWTIRPDGTDQKLFGGGVRAEYLKWSQDGKYLYYSVEEGVMKIDSKGIGPETKIMDCGFAGNRFDLSPDEKWLIHEDEGPDGEGHLHRVAFPQRGEGGMID